MIGRQTRFGIGNSFAYKNSLDGLLERLVDDAPAKYDNLTADARQHGVKNAERRGRLIRTRHV